MEIIIRKYEERDWETLVKYLEDLQDIEADADPIGYVVKRDGFGEPYFANILDTVVKDDGVIYIAETEGAAVGFVACVVKQLEEYEKLARSTDKSYGYITEIVVAPEARGKSVGSLLMAKAEEYFRAKGCAFSTLSVFAPNTRACEFYRKNGYIDRNISFLKKL